MKIRTVKDGRREITYITEPSPDLALEYTPMGKPFFVRMNRGRKQYVGDADPEKYPYKK